MKIKMEKPLDTFTHRLNVLEMQFYILGAISQIILMMIIL